jgi:molybdenum cofactor cytidylyltransferase
MMTAIVLAAGQSTRMGSLKQLLPLREGKPVIQVVVEQVSASGVDEVVVVLGFRAKEIAMALSSTGARIAINQDFESGMTSSVRCGIRAATSAQSYLICLGDQPLVDVAVITAVVTAANTSGTGIVIPTYEGKGGHPIFIDGRHAEEILRLGPDEGLNTFTHGHADDTVRLPVDDRNVLEDMDTPADYARLAARFRASST